MVGESMKIRYTRQFGDSLEQIINYWQNKLQLSSITISCFTDHISQKINLLTDFPQMGTDITDLYQFNQTTYRLLIGHSYEIFYRIDKENNSIVVGSIFSTAQVKVKF
ncbi:type II toxin-antitoxin system RelE/ParE family toxin [Limosilactobacillus balticus]|uniref:type II toxin-antitoxin system RelE/ParE family toxin n=1 Tax=Limosilactobacillus balticus TaxID=2759747 RepID=UPI0039954717